MKFLVQRVKEVKVFFQNEEIETLSDGFLIFVGIEKEDENKDLSQIGKKLLQYQVMEREGKFSLSLQESKLPVLFISQITLTANFDNGRINFNQSPNFSTAKKIYDEFITEMKKYYPSTKNTSFGSYLMIESINIGPVNFFLEI